MRKAQTNNPLVQASFYLTLILGNIFIVDITTHVIIELNVFVFWLILILFYKDIRRWERGLIMRGLIIVTMEEVMNISQRLTYHSRYHHNNKPEYCDGYKHCHQCGHRSAKHRSVSSFRYEICGCVMGRRRFSIKVAMSRKFFAMVGWRRKFGVCLRKRPAQFLSLVFLKVSL